MMSPTAKPSAYRPDIDGLRAIAVLLVVLYHARISFRGGFVGVDVFFVISGYLITGLMLRDLELGRFSLADFWERRVRRIFPALAVMSFGTLAAGMVLLFPEDLSALGSSLLAQVCLVSNLYFWSDSGGYFAGAAEEKPLLHTWSLAVEEQFYLGMPFLCLLLARRWSRSPAAPSLREKCLKVFALLLAVGFLLAAVVTSVDAHAAFYWLPTRAWELLMGACLACLPAGRPKVSGAWASALAWTALAVLLITGWVYSRKTLFPGIAALPPSLATAVLIWAGGLDSGGAAVSRILASRALMKIGLLSYSFYLWHWPVVAFMNYLNAGTSDFPGKAGRTILMAVALGIAWCSWRWVETPVRQGRILKSRRALFSAALAVSALLLAAGAGLVIQHGFPGSQDPQVLRYASAGVEDRARRAWQDDPEDAFRDTLPVLGVKNPSRPPRVLLWGDSHAMTLAPVVSSWCEELGESGLLAAHSATVPMFGYYRQSRSGLDSRGPAWAEAVFELIRKHRIPEVILTAYWKESTGRDPDPFASALLKTVQRLSGAGARVWLVLDVPELPFEVPRALAFHQKLPWLVTDPRRLATTREEHAENNRLLLRLAPELAKAGARVLDPSSLLFNQDGRCKIEQDGVPLYGDSHHLTIPGTLLLRPLFKPVFLP